MLGAVVVATERGTEVGAWPWFKGGKALSCVWGVDVWGFDVLVDKDEDGLDLITLVFC